MWIEGKKRKVYGCKFILRGLGQYPVNTFCWFMKRCGGSISSDLSSGVITSRVWVQNLVITIWPLSKALNHKGLVKVGKVVPSALPARLLVDDTHAYALANYEEGNPVAAPGVMEMCRW